MTANTIYHQHPNQSGLFHLQAGIEISDGPVKIVSLSMVDSPAVQLDIFKGNIVTRTDVINHAPFIQTFVDPRIARGIYTEEVGHSYAIRNSGIIYVIIPFTRTEDLSSVEIRIANIEKLELKDKSINSLGELLKHPGKKLDVVSYIQVSQLKTHPDWVKLTKNLGLQADAGKIEIYRDRSKKFRWRLVNANGEKLADSSHDYDTLEQCEIALRWIRSNWGSIRVTVLPDDGSY